MTINPKKEATKYLKEYGSKNMAMEAVHSDFLSTNIPYEYREFNIADNIKKQIDLKSRNKKGRYIR